MAASCDRSREGPRAGGNREPPAYSGRRRVPNARARSLSAFDDDREEVDLFHCGVWAKSVMHPGAKITEHQILAKEVGIENSWGTIDGDLKPGACASLRPCTNAR